MDAANILTPPAAQIIGTAVPVAIGATPRERGVSGPSATIPYRGWGRNVPLALRSKIRRQWTWSVSTEARVRRCLPAAEPTLDLSPAATFPITSAATVEASVVLAAPFVTPEPGDAFLDSWHHLGRRWQVPGQLRASLRPNGRQPSRRKMKPRKESLLLARWMDD